MLFRLLTAQRTQTLNVLNVSDITVTEKIVISCPTRTCILKQTKPELQLQQLQ